MSFSEIMVDLETMSLAKDAAIVAIGAVRFDLDTSTLGDTFYKTISLRSSQRAGGRIDGDTVIWWMSQSDIARLALTSDSNVLIETALIEFSNWCREAPITGVWGNGVALDNVVLEAAYLRLGKTPPWTYKQDKCYRTMKALFPEVEEKEFVGEEHNALDDAIHQTKHLCRIWKHIQSIQNITVENKASGELLIK